MSESSRSSRTDALASLKPALVLAKTKAESLDGIKSLNLWGCGLTDVALLSQMPQLEVVSLSLNRLETLRDFAHLPQLQELYLRKNNIGDVAEVVYLQGLRQLHTLWLSENPCENSVANEETEWYRTFVLRMLPQLRKLDNVMVSDDERSQAVATNHSVLHRLHRRAKALAQRTIGQDAPLLVGGIGDGTSSNRSRVSAAGAPDPLTRSYIHMEGRPIQGLKSAMERMQQAPNNIEIAANGNQRGGQHGARPVRKEAPVGGMLRGSGIRGFDPEKSLASSLPNRGGRAANPMSPPQKLAQRVESERNPLDFLGDGEGINKRQSNRSFVKSHNAVPPSAKQRSSAAKLILPHESPIERFDRSAVLNHKCASESAYDVALMLLERMNYDDLKRIASAAEGMLKVRERK